MFIVYTFINKYFLEVHAMNLERLYTVLNNKEKVDVYYNERPVWIQEVNDNIAKVSFIDNFEEKDVYIEDLYESDLYN